jgi:hypothetical protein
MASFYAGWIALGASSELLCLAFLTPAPHCNSIKTLKSLRTASDFCHRICSIYLRLSIHTDMTIHWKVLEWHVLMYHNILKFRFIFGGKSNFRHFPQKRACYKIESGIHSWCYCVAKRMFQINAIFNVFFLLDWKATKQNLPKWFFLKKMSESHENIQADRVSRIIIYEIFISLTYTPHLHPWVSDK